MTWGHAISDDLMHWQQLEHALYPDEHGTMFSGTAMVDTRNVLGLQSGSVPTLVLFYTAAGGHNPESIGKGFTQCLATSTDGGRTFIKHPANPIVPTLGIKDRDPRVFWHEPSQHYVMVLYVGRPHPTLIDAQGKPVVVHGMVFMSSTDLLQWHEESFVPGMFECPELIEMHVEETQESKWVLWAADSRYYIGHFDGRVFTPQSEFIAHDYGANYYAAQCFANAPGGRNIALGWMRGGQYPGMPFNQQMGLPTELTLCRDGLGLRLYRQPVQEIQTLHDDSRLIRSSPLSKEIILADGSTSAGYDVELSLAIETGSIVEMRVRGLVLLVDGLRKGIQVGDRLMPVLFEENKLKLRLLIDRTSVEIFANEGRTAGSWCLVPIPGEPALAIKPLHGQTMILGGTIYTTKSVWGNLQST